MELTQAAFSIKYAPSNPWQRGYCRCRIFVKRDMLSEGQFHFQARGHQGKMIKLSFYDHFTVSLVCYCF